MVPLSCLNDIERDISRTHLSSMQRIVIVALRIKGPLSTNELMLAAGIKNTNRRSLQRAVLYMVDKGIVGRETRDTGRGGSPEAVYTLRKDP